MPASRKKTSKKETVSIGNDNRIRKPPRSSKNQASTFSNKCKQLPIASYRTGEISSKKTSVAEILDRNKKEHSSNEKEKGAKVCNKEDLTELTSWVEDSNRSPKNQETPLNDEIAIENFPDIQLPKQKKSKRTLKRRNDNRVCKSPRTLKNQASFSSNKCKQLLTASYRAGEISKKTSAVDILDRNKKEHSSNEKEKGANVCNKEDLTELTSWVEDSNRSPKNQETPLNDEIAIEDEDFPDIQLPKQEKSKETLKRTTNSDRFAKYGFHVPTYEEIIEQHKEYDRFVEMIKKLEEINNYTFESVKIDFSIPKPRTPKVTLDCKNLTVNGLQRACRRNYKYVRNICYGISYCERHERYQHQRPQDRYTTRDLTYNTSMIMFTYEQKEVLLNFLIKKFDNDAAFGPRYKYIFKVLLPELCLKIFMDTYKMDYESAIQYLKYKP